MNFVQILVFLMFHFICFNRFQTTGLEKLRCPSSISRVVEGKIAYLVNSVKFCTDLFWHKKIQFRSVVQNFNSLLMIS